MLALDGRKLQVNSAKQALHHGIEILHAQKRVRASLTPREREVFEMLARGRDSFYIQERLMVSRNTVKAHVKHIYAKLDIHTHQELLDIVELEMAS